MPRDAYLRHRVLAADPVELIHILYEHALTQVKAARAAMAAGDIAGRSAAIAKALASLGELEASLNHDAGGSLSRNLGRLYRYMRKRLTAANVKQDKEALAEVESLLRTLEEGWSAMQRNTLVSAAATYGQVEVESGAHSWSA
jgi:flagellar protein FliS